MSKLFRYGGIAASLVLIAFGVTSIVIGVNGRSTVKDNLAAEKISGTPDMTTKATTAAIAEAKLKGVTAPSCSVAGKAVDSGTRARCFAQYMRIHALEATGGQVYAQMGRYLDQNGKPTDDAKAAAIDPKSKQPVSNPARDIWVNETALSTALNTSYFAENVATFAIVMGVALLLCGIGFGVLCLGLVGERGERTRTSPATSEPLTA